MKKRLLIASSLLLACLTLFVVLAAVDRSKALSVNENFQIDGTVLMKYYGNDEVCVIPDSVTEIGSGAFEGNGYVKRIIFNDKLEKIDYNAFAEMPLLERVVLPDSVNFIGSSSFANCPNLTSFYMGKGVSEIGNCPFAGCNNLTDLQINDNNEYFTVIDSVLYSADRTVLCEMLPGRDKTYYICPETVSYVKPYALWGCDSLLYVTLSDNLVTIGAYAFSNVPSMKAVSLSFNSREISMKAFENCKSLEQIYIPDSLYKIHETAFDGCDSLAIYAFEGSFGANYAIENDIKVIYSPIYDLNIAALVREEQAKEEAEARKEANNKEELPPVDIAKDSIGATIVVNNEAVVLMDPEKMAVIDGADFKSGYNNLLRNSILDNRIPDNLFYLKTDLKEINIPGIVKTIGEFSFSRSGLESIYIPEGVETIKKGAFYHCDNLKEVVIPSTVTVIEKNAFDKTPWLENWYETSEDDYLIVGDGVLLAYKGDKDSFVMPENVKYVSCDIE